MKCITPWQTVGELAGKYKQIMMRCHWHSFINLSLCDTCKYCSSNSNYTVTEWFPVPEKISPGTVISFRAWLDTFWINEAIYYDHNANANISCTGSRSNYDLSDYILKLYILHCHHWALRIPASTSDNTTTAAAAAVGAYLGPNHYTGMPHCHHWVSYQPILHNYQPAPKPF